MTVEELRIGNIVFDKRNQIPIIVAGISDEGHIITRDKNGLASQIEIINVGSIAMDSNLIQAIKNQGIVQQDYNRENIYLFPKQTSTYFLVYDSEEYQYFMGMIDVNLPEGYRRLTRPFYEYHKLQNAYKTTFDIELKRLKF
jgi:hypothetical protein